MTALAIPASIEGQKTNPQRLLAGQYDGPFTINDVSGLFVRLGKNGQPEVSTRKELGIPHKVGRMTIPNEEQLKLANGAMTSSFITKDCGGYFAYKLKVNNGKPEITNKQPLVLKTVQQYLHSSLERVKSSGSTKEAKCHFEGVSHLLDATELRIFGNEAKKADGRRKAGELSQLKASKSKSKESVALSPATKRGFKEEIRNQLSEERPKEEKKERKARGKSPGLGRGKSNPRF